MKRLKHVFFAILLATIFSACQTDPGPVGPPGPQGPVGPPGASGSNGVNIVGLMYEVEFDLNSGNEWSFIYPFPAEDEILDTDVVLVYILNGQTDAGKDIWRLMPLNFYDNRGIRSINYDFTADDVNIFEEASFDLDPNTDHFDNEIARVVVVPADASANQRKAPVDYSDFEAVKKAFNLKEPKKLQQSL